MSEAWRLRKNTMSAEIPSHLQLHIFIISTVTSVPSFIEVGAAMDKAFKLLLERIENGTDKEQPSTPE
jgi:hypothetical protein